MIIQIINVLIGLAAVYLIFSTIASALFELVEGLLKRRGKLLERGIREILSKVGFGEALTKQVADAAVKKFYQSPVINPLFEGEHIKGSRTLPSYIPPERFVSAVLLLAQQPAAEPPVFAQLKELAETLVGNRALAAGESFAKKVEEQLLLHFNDAMDRVSGRFVRYSRVALLLIGLVLAWGANIDTIQIVQTLSVDQTLSDKIADAAAAQFKDMQADVVAPAASANSAAAAASAPTASAVTDNADPAVAVDKQIDLVRSQIGIARELGLPIGWTSRDVDLVFGRSQKADASSTDKKLPSPPTDLGFPAAFWKKFFGVLVTAIALSFGAPFWFGLLNQLVDLRTTLKPGDKDKAGTAATPSGDKSAAPRK